MIEPYSRSKRILYTDSCYSSVNLALKLKQQKIGFTGIIQNNKIRLPKDFNNIKLHSKGDTLFAYAITLICVKHTDNKK